MDCMEPAKLPLSMGILQARRLQWGAISTSTGSFRPRDQTHASCISRRILYQCAIWEALFLGLPFLYFTGKKKDGGRKGRKEGGKEENRLVYQ